MDQAPALLRSRTALPHPNAGPHTVAAAVYRDRPVLLLASGTIVYVLDENLHLSSSFGFAAAFPAIADDASASITALAVDPDPASRRVAVACGRRVAIFEAGRFSSWRVHSQVVASAHVQLLDLAGQIMVTVHGQYLAAWSCPSATASYVDWREITSTRLRDWPAGTLKLSPSARRVAVVQENACSVDVYTIEQGPDGARFKATQAQHRLPVGNAEWRCHTDDSEDVLLTTSVDGALRVWGCMIDEPDCFTLWSAMEPEGTAHLPICTSHLASSDMSLVDTTRVATVDYFVSVRLDGSIHLVTAHNLSAKPPTLISQASISAKGPCVPPQLLAKLRHTTLMRSPPGSGAWKLVGKGSRGTMIVISLDLSFANASKQNCYQADLLVEDVRVIDLAMLPPLKTLGISSDARNAFLFTPQGRIQSWTAANPSLMYEDEGQDGEYGFVSDLDAGSVTCVANWDHAMWACATEDRLHLLKVSPRGRLRLVNSLLLRGHMLSSMVGLPQPQGVHASVIVATTAANMLVTFAVDSSDRVRLVFEQDVCGDPPRHLAIVPATLPSNVDGPDCVRALSVASDGTLRYWALEMPLGAAPQWQLCASVKTAIVDSIMAVGGSTMKAAIVSAEEESARLTIWDSQSSSFSSGLEFAHLFESSAILDVAWSCNALALAVVFADRIEVFCQQLMDDYTHSPGWGPLARLDPVAHGGPFKAAAWLATGGLVAVAGEQVVFHSPRLTGTVDWPGVASARISPLPFYHPQLLMQCLLHGKVDFVFEVLSALAGQITSDGSLAPSETGERLRLTPLSDFGEGVHRALKTSSNFLRNGLSDEDARRLHLAAQQRNLRSLSDLQHQHFELIVATVMEVQRRHNAIDENGLRFLTALRYFDIRQAQEPAGVPSHPERIKYRDMILAWRSETQSVLVDSTTEGTSGRMTWVRARSLGIPLWLKSPEQMRSLLENIGRAEFHKPEADERDPVTASVFYLALRKKHVVTTFWKQSIGHSDQRNVLKFLANDFSLPRWRTAALKNAYALLSKQRFMFAVCFFLLGESLKDAVNVCLRSLNDFQLALALSRSFEGEQGPVWRSIIESNITPFAFRHGYRWLAFWCLWSLDRRDLATQAVVAPLTTVASQMSLGITEIGSLPHEDPSLIILYAQIRSWSLQTIKGALGVPGATEVDFLLHVSRILCRMGCHILALDLARSWTFRDTPPRPSKIRHSQPPMHARRSSLLLPSTKQDISESALPSRASSPGPRETPSPDAPAQTFLRQVKKEVKSVPEFDMGSFF